MDQYVSAFCTDCMGVLKKYDEKIRNNLLTSEHASFYENDNKGIAVGSITEPIVKFMIFSDLCKKYPIWPECSSYYGDSGKILDIALYAKEQADLEAVVDPDIAIEIKWAGFTQDGKFLKWSLDNCVDDLYKLHKECEIPNKYVMQIAISDPLIQWRYDILQQQILDRFDKRKIKGKNIKFVFSDSFDTCGGYTEDRKKFYVLLWKIE